MTSIAGGSPFVARAWAICVGLTVQIFVGVAGSHSPEEHGGEGRDCHNQSFDE
ncbi:hypothetical protein RZF22_003051 [Citrobacter freundii]|nr:hypothetical protein [Citrobacter freundii]